MNSYMYYNINTSREFKVGDSLFLSSERAALDISILYIFCCFTKISSSRYFYRKGRINFQWSRIFRFHVYLTSKIIVSFAYTSVYCTTLVGEVIYLHKLQFHNIFVCGIK